MVISGNGERAMTKKPLGIYPGGGSMVTDSLPNHLPLSPMDFLKRANRAYRNRVAVIDGDRQMTYGEFHDRAMALSGGLEDMGLKPGDCVAVLCPNSAAMLEVHYAIPAAGLVINAMNNRLDPGSIAYILDHSGAKMLMVHPILAGQISEILDQCAQKPILILMDWKDLDGGEIGQDLTYEALLARGENAPSFILHDELQPIAINYTSGTTGKPKGARYTHRGAFLNALGNALTLGLQPTSRYLWTLPLFHCNGWTHSWGVTAAGATHVCLPRIDAADIFARIADHHVTHMAGAPIVMSIMLNAPEQVRRSFSSRVFFYTGGAPAPAAVLSAMSNLGFDVMHAYGLTEVYGPSLACFVQDEWLELDFDERAEFTKRQGVPHVTAGDSRVINPETMEEVPWDGKTMGEIMQRGNTIMEGYYNNQEATDVAFASGWFHTGDLAVMHPDGYIEVRDRAKDIIISGGENISSVEVENALYKHEAVMAVAVVAKPDATWGEVPCAFVELKDGQQVSPEELMEFARGKLAGFKKPKEVIIGELPKTSTGKIQKFQLRARLT